MALRRSLLLCLIVLSVLSISDLPWVIYRTAWFVLGLPAPPASAFYTAKLTNATCHDLIVTLQSLNDLPFRTFSEWVERQRGRLGWCRYKECRLAPGAGADLTLPLQSDPRTALFLVVVRTEKSSPALRQGIGLFVMSWPWGQGQWKWRDRETLTGWQEGNLQINEEDLTFLDLEELQQMPGDPLRDGALSILRKSTERNK